MTGSRAARHRDPDAGLGFLDRRAGLTQCAQRRFHFVGLGADQLDIALSNHRGAGVAACLDPVGHDAVRRAVQAIDALDRQRLGTDAVDVRAHRDQAIAQVDDLGLARRIFEHAGALGEHRRHQRIFGGADRHDGEGELTAG